MNKIIPGHARAFTIWFFVILAVVVYFKTGDWSNIGGLFLLILGSFLGDQTTHLAQSDHSGIPPTWIEREMQGHRYLWIFIGVIIAVVGLVVILSK